MVYHYEDGGQLLDWQSQVGYKDYRDAQADAADYARRRGLPAIIGGENEIRETVAEGKARPGSATQG